MSTASATTSQTSDSALALLSSLVLEDGRRWGEAAYPWQWRDAAAIVDEHSPEPYSFLTRPRGGSKSSDVAAIALSVMVTQAPVGAQLYAVAADRDQGALLLDSIAGFVRRTPYLAGAVELTSYCAAIPDTGVSLTVLAADAASAYGLRPYFLAIDELAQWQETPGSLKLFEAVRTAPGKVNGRMVIITTAGSPTHFAASVRDHARNDPLWRLHEVAGPVPWVSPERLDEQRRALPQAVFERLHMNIWAEPEDRLASLEAVRACVTHTAPLPPKRDASYVVGLDIGLVDDPTAVAICHAEAHADDDWHVVVDDVRIWKGSRAAPVQLREVLAFLEATAKAYRDVHIVFDPHQAASIAQALRAKGIRASQYNFTTGSVNRLTRVMMSAIHNRTIGLPDDAELVNEISRLRLVETSPTQFRLEHRTGEHNDRAIAIALAAQQLFSKPPGAGPRLRVLGPW